jgi:hypothetical protein
MARTRTWSEMRLGKDLMKRNWNPKVLDHITGICVLVCRVCVFDVCVAVHLNSLNFNSSKYKIINKVR